MSTKTYFEDEPTGNSELAHETRAKTRSILRLSLVMIIPMIYVHVDFGKKGVLISYTWAVYMGILFEIEVRSTTVMFLGLTFWPAKCGWRMKVTSEDLTTE